MEDSQVGAYRVLLRIGNDGMGSAWLADTVTTPLRE